MSKDMERLTNSIDYCQIHCDFGEKEDCFFNDKTKCYENNLYNRLREYEIAEEQGLLLRLPCPIGTTVYNITWWDIVQEKVKVNGKTFCRETHKHKVSKSTFSFMDIKDFGKTVFLTKEEAEHALKQVGE